MYIQEFWNKIYFPSPSAFFQIQEALGPHHSPEQLFTDIFTISNKIVAISKTILLIKQFKIKL